MQAGLGRTAEFMGLSNWLRVVVKKFLEVLCTRPDDKQSSKGSASDRYSRLSRFIFQQAHFSKTRARLKPNAFMPKPPNLKISAIWNDELVDHEIWQIGDTFGEARSKPALARADFGVAAVLEAKLSIEPNPRPHPRHVDICGWPSAKDEQISIAMLFCNRATLRVR